MSLSETSSESSLDSLESKSIPISPSILNEQRNMMYKIKKSGRNAMSYNNSMGEKEGDRCLSKRHNRTLQSRRP